MYGEGDQALGGLLAQLLTSLGNTSILAWTGKSGSFNSCLLTNITVFKQFPPSHIPPAIASTEMEKLTTTLRVSSLSSALVMKLYDQLHDLPLPLFVGQWLKLPCLRFKLRAVTSAQNSGGHVFHVQTDLLGIVEIKTEEDLYRCSPLYLVHPWIDFLLDRQPVGSIIEMISKENTEDQSSSMSELLLSSLPGPLNITSATRHKDASSLPLPSSVPQRDKLTQALHMIAQLKQPFGALLLAKKPGKVAVYRRVAVRTLIMVKMEKIMLVVLNNLLTSMRVLEVL